MTVINEETIDKVIRDALLPICPDVNRSTFTGQETGTREKKIIRYFTFNYTILPMFPADDRARIDRYLVQVHYFCPYNDKVKGIINSTRLALEKAGFTMPSYTPIDDMNGQHLVFECENEGEIDYGED